MTFIIRPDGKLYPRWCHRTDDNLPDMEKALALVESLTYLKKCGAGKFLSCGKMLKMPPMTVSTERFDGDEEGYFDIPNVFGARYELDGKIMTILANHTDKEQTVIIGNEAITVPKLGGRLFFDKK